MEYEEVQRLIDLHEIDGLTAIVSFNTGLVSNKMGDFPAAIERYMQFIVHAKDVNNLSLRVTALQSVGNTYT